MTYTTTRYGSRFVRFRSTLARESRARASMAPLDDAFDVEFIDDAVDEAVRDASRARSSGGARAPRCARRERNVDARRARRGRARAGGARTRSSLADVARRRRRSILARRRDARRRRERARARG